ncbi:ABC transporter ATP-binding protein [Candidatus Thioglobus sp.]|nr:ABC transporter ATP-binding protein [Candidatus Thioglobus sp.]MDB3893313.1 ABC transporter ATP-binding protein [Candidatus Thioglobus sp.]MDC0904134.1 ABC transporter ATP-binding protein [Candidatus Thioglobus sp.]MDC0920117.1 ABC transporter ATP-binding protein [Candidatus Thioglobus sp.]MDC0965170.1 ABC transporter ATP-binding protein [Candidatus Thioglobus sp.]
MITVNQLLKTYKLPSGDDLPVLRNVNFTIKTGQSVAITGTSGSGKTTLLSLLAGIDNVTSGNIVIDKEEITCMSENQLTKFRSQKLGFIFQSFYLLPHLNVLENVALPLDIVAKDDANDKAKELLKLVGLSSRQDALPNKLSGGEKQRVAIARALINEPKVIFADEPTGNLDVETGQIITNLLFDLVQSKNLTLLLVTHDLALADRCDRELKLTNGQLDDV